MAEHLLNPARAAPLDDFCCPLLPTATGPAPVPVRERVPFDRTQTTSRGLHEATGVRGPCARSDPPPALRRRQTQTSRPRNANHARKRKKGPAPSGARCRVRCLAVREGGVEPPRPFGHWNLNPARLPIPPPAHGCCRVILPQPRSAVGPSRCLRERLPTCRTLARARGGFTSVSGARSWQPRRLRTGSGRTRDGGAPSPLRDTDRTRIYHPCEGAGHSSTTSGRRSSGSDRRPGSGCEGRHCCVDGRGGTTCFSGAWIRSVSSMSSTTAAGPVTSRARPPRPKREVHRGSTEALRAPARRSRQRHLRQGLQVARSSRSRSRARSSASATTTRRSGTATAPSSRTTSSSS